jgi:hypothetical protein
MRVYIGGREREDDGAGGVLGSGGGWGVLLQWGLLR